MCKFQILSSKHLLMALGVLGQIVQLYSYRQLLGDCPQDCAVCHHWCLVVVDYAILWRNIAFTTSALSTINCATTFLQRSKRTSLHVHIWDISGHLPSHTPPQHALTHLLSLISSQQNHIVLLKVIESSIQLLNTFQGPANNISQLILQGCTSMNHLDPFFAKLPNVQQITLIYPTPCHLGSFTSLT